MQQSTDHEQSTHYLIIDNHTPSWSCEWTKGLKIESTVVDSSSWICAWWCSAPTKSKFSCHDHHHTAIPDVPSFRKITKIPIPLQKSSSWVQSQSCRSNDCFQWNHSLPSQTLATKFTTWLILWKEGTRNKEQGTINPVLHIINQKQSRLINDAYGREIKFDLREPSQRTYGYFELEFICGFGDLQGHLQCLT